MAVLASHADGVVDGGKRIASSGAFGHAQHALDGRRDAEAETREKRCQGTAGDERHDNEEEDLPRVALGVVLEVAEEALELLEAALQEALAGRALIVRRAAWCVGSLAVIFYTTYEAHTVSKQAGAAVVAAQAEERAARAIVLAVAAALAVKEARAAAPGRSGPGSGPRPGS